MTKQRRRICAAAAATLGLLVTAIPAEAAPRDEIRAKRAEAKAALHRIDELGMALEPVIQRFDRAVELVQHLDQRIAYNRERISTAKSNIKRGEQNLAAQLVATYKREGDVDIVVELLASGSIENVLDLEELLARSRSNLSRTLTGLGFYRADLAARRKALARDHARAESLREEAAAQQRRIEQTIDEQRSLVVGLRRQIKRLKAEERARQRRIAEEARRRLAAMRSLAAAGAYTSIGGSVSGVPPVELAGDRSRGATAARAALQWLGTPYSWGGGNTSGPTRGFCGPAGCQGSYTTGFDCSGLTLYAWAQAGVSLGHYTGTQWNQGRRVYSMSDLIVGDLVFFGSSLGHMGMYIGAGQMVHAPHTGDVVKISTITSGYYASSFSGGVRPG